MGMWDNYGKSTEEYKALLDSQIASGNTGQYYRKENDKYYATRNQPQQTSTPSYSDDDKKNYDAWIAAGGDPNSATAMEDYEKWYAGQNQTTAVPETAVPNETIYNKKPSNMLYTAIKNVQSGYNPDKETLNSNVTSNQFPTNNTQSLNTWQYITQPDTLDNDQIQKNVKNYDEIRMLQKLQEIDSDYDPSTKHPLMADKTTGEYGKVLGQLGVFDIAHKLGEATDNFFNRGKGAQEQEITTDSEIVKLYQQEVDSGRLTEEEFAFKYGFSPTMLPTIKYLAHPNDYSIEEENARENGLLKSEENNYTIEEENAAEKKALDNQAPVVHINEQQIQKLADDYFANVMNGSITDKTFQDINGLSDADLLQVIYSAKNNSHTSNGFKSIVNDSNKIKLDTRPTDGSDRLYNKPMSKEEALNDVYNNINPAYTAVNNQFNKTYENALDDKMPDVFNGTLSKGQQQANAEEAKRNETSITPEQIPNLSLSYRNNVLGGKMSDEQFQIENGLSDKDMMTIAYEARNQQSQIVRENKGIPRSKNETSMSFQTSPNGKVLNEGVKDANLIKEDIFNNINPAYTNLRSDIGNNTFGMETQNQSKPIMQSDTPINYFKTTSIPRVSNETTLSGTNYINPEVLNGKNLFNPTPEQKSALASMYKEEVESGKMSEDYFKIVNNLSDKDMMDIVYESKSIESKTPEILNVLSSFYVEEVMGGKMSPQRFQQINNLTDQDMLSVINGAKTKTK